MPYFARSDVMRAQGVCCIHTPFMKDALDLLRMKDLIPVFGIQTAAAAHAIPRSFR